MIQRHTMCSRLGRRVVHPSGKLGIAFKSSNFVRGYSFEHWIKLIARLPISKGSIQCSLDVEDTSEAGSHSRHLPWIQITTVSRPYDIDQGHSWVFQDDRIG